jgi:CheY-like chemotaxis protein
MNKKSYLILCVDDEIELLEYLEELIERNPLFKVITATNGEEALEVLKKNNKFLGLGPNKIDCIILDIKMPEMDGIELLKTYRQSEFFLDSMPIIMLTAYEDEKKWAELTNVISGRIAHYLKKPVDQDKLLDTLERILINKETEIMVELTREKSYSKRKELYSQKTAPNSD